MPTITKKHTKVNYTDVIINVKYIVIHDTGVKGQSAKDNANYFYSENRGASAHYFVDENDIYEVVSPNKKGWHIGDDRAGDSHDVGDLINNSNTIGIELCPELDGTFKPETLANGAWLTQKLMKENKVPAKNVVRHYDASGKNCPQFLNTDGKWTKWYSYHKQLTGQSVNPINTSPAKSATNHTVKAGDTLWGLSKQYNATVAQIKEWNKLKSDTINVGDKLTLKATEPTNNPPMPVAKPAQAPVKNTSSKNTVELSIQAKVGVKQDGILGRNSKFEIVKLAQRWIGVEADGAWGNTSYNRSKTARPKEDSLYVYAIQAMLYAKGFKAGGTPDGKYGNNTVQAVKDFQKANGLLVDGIAGKATQMKLFKI